MCSRRSGRISSSTMKLLNPSNHPLTTPNQGLFLASNSAPIRPGHLQLGVQVAPDTMVSPSTHPGTSEPSSIHLKRSKRARHGCPEHLESFRRSTSSPYFNAFFSQFSTSCVLLCQIWKLRQSNFKETKRLHQACQAAEDSARFLMEPLTAEMSHWESPQMKVPSSQSLQRSPGILEATKTGHGGPRSVATPK